MSAADALIDRPKHALIQLDFESSLAQTFHERALYVPLSPDTSDVESGILMMVEALFDRQLEFLKPLRDYLHTGEKAHPELITNALLHALSSLPAFHITLVLDDVSLWDKPEWVPILESLLEHGQQSCQFTLVVRDACQHLPLKDWRARGLVDIHQASENPKPLQHFDIELDEDTQELYEMTASGDIDTKQDYALKMGRSTNYILAGNGRNMLRFFESIPFKCYLERPHLGMAWLWAQALTLNVSERMQEVMAAVSQYVQQQQAADANPTQEDIFLAAQFQLFVANVFGSGPHAQDYVPIVKEAIENLETHDDEDFQNEELVCFGQYNLGLALFLTDLEAARPLLEKASDVAKAYRNFFIHIFFEVARATARIDVQEGDWAKAVEDLKNRRVRRFLNYAGEAGMKTTTIELHLSVQPMYVGLCTASESLLRYFRQDTDKAHELATNAFDHGKSMGHPESMIEPLITLSLLEAQKHAYVPAQEHLLLAFSIAQRVDLFHVQAALSAHIARMHMRVALHNVDLAPLELVANWVRQTRLADDWQQPRTYVPIMLHTPEFEALTYARYLLLTGDTAKTLEIITWAQQQIEARGASFPLYETELLQALCSEGLTQAQQHFAAALDHVRAQDAPRLLLDFGAILGARLETLLGDTERDDWLQKLMDDFAQDNSVFPIPNGEERAILQLMAKGMKHEEIAENRDEDQKQTMAYIQNIYRMLDVNQRSDALSKARRFGWV